jgi:hypothetical protein
VAAAGVAGLGETACGSSANAAPIPDTGTGTDGSDPVEAADEAIVPDPTYPAAHAPLPVVSFHGGTIIERPKVVTVTFDGEMNRALLDQFGDAITTTSWWDAVRAGYCDSANHCVGKGQGGGHGHLASVDGTSFTDATDPTAPSSLRDAIMQNVASGALPAADESTIYVIYLPKAATVSLDGKALCVALSAYHNFGLYTPSASDAGGGNADAGGADEAGADAAPASRSPIAYAYAVIPSCGFEQVPQTSAASHEIIEAATNPTFTAFYMRDVAWTYDGAENADLCVTHSGSDRWEDGGAEIYQEGSYSVQRSWSNAAAVASHDPCVPAPAGVPYFNVAPPTNQENVSLKLGAQKTVELVAFSDGPVPDFDVSAEELSVVRGGSGVLGLSLDQTRANNGTKISLSITANAKPTSTPVRLFVIAKSGEVSHAWPMTVSIN